MEKDPYPELNTAWELFLNETDKLEAIRITEENKIELRWGNGILNFIYPWNECIEDCDEYTPFTNDEIEFMLYVENSPGIIHLTPSLLDSIIEV